MFCLLQSKCAHRSVPTLRWRIAQDLFGGFWICKLRWKGIFKSLKEGVVDFFIRRQTNLLQPI